MTTRREYRVVAERDGQQAVTATCGWWIGPVWKLGGETCVCTLDADHEMPHRCACGTWFEGCGHPPEGRS